MCPLGCFQECIFHFDQFSICQKSITLDNEIEGEVYISQRHFLCIQIIGKNDLSRFIENLDLAIEE